MGVHVRAWIRRVITVPVLSLVLLGIVACGGAATTVTSTPGPLSGGQPAEDGLLAPNFTMLLYTGSQLFGGAQTVSLSDLRGKAVILNFWAPLCPPCRAEMPDFEALWQEIQGQDVVILGIDVGPFTGLGNREQAVEFLTQIKLTYPTGEALTGQVVSDYSVFGMPTTVFITPGGRVMRSWTGVISKSKLTEIMTELLGTS